MPIRSRGVALVSILAAMLACGSAVAQDLEALPLADALEVLRKQGLSILYSSDLVTAEMRVLNSPQSQQPLQILQEILQPHGLVGVEAPNESIMIVRAGQAASAMHTDPDSDLSAETISSVVVEASRYELLRHAPIGTTQMTSSELQLIPNLGEDPLRVLARLPGAATNDFSAKVHVRGGHPDEVIVRLDGLRLYTPFHLKDFQSIFSAIDTLMVDRIDFYSGGYPVHLGERMSGVIDVHSIDVPGAGYREISLSVFHAAALASGQINEAQSDWLLSARRGNLDLVLDWTKSDLGSPNYVDLYGRFTHRVSNALSLSGNFLVLDDNIRLNDSDLEERAEAKYQDTYLWATVDYALNEAYNFRGIFSRTLLDSFRRGEADQEGIGRGALEDRRSHSIDSAALEMTWMQSETAFLRAGFEWRQLSGQYDYADSAEFDVLIVAPGIELAPQRFTEVHARPRGDQYGAYASVRFAASDRFTADVGLRWDHSNLSAAPDGELSPRVALLYEWSDSTLLRASWGRFSQPQGIDELQASDGLAEFSPAQHAEHWVASVEHLFDGKSRLRVEGFRKRYDNLRPRFENLLNTIVLLPELKPDRAHIVPQRAVAEGVEVALRSDEARSAFWWLSYTWSRVRDEIGGVMVARAWDQTHSMSAGAVWQNPAWQLSAAAGYHTGWPQTVLFLVTTDPMPTAIAARSSNRLRTYADLDVRVARKFYLEGSGLLTVFFELSNALNRRSDCCVEFEFEEEEGQRSLEQEKIKSLPLLPSFGFSWKF